VWGTGEKHIKYWSGSLRKRDHLEGPGVDVKVKLKRILRKSAETLSELVGSGSGQEQLAGYFERSLTFRFHKVRGISWLDEDMLAPWN
jgi:hypothetical protein